MTTIITIFIMSLVISLILTPLAGRIANRFGMVDLPSERKVHTHPIPRAGGIAMFIAFYLPFSLMLFYKTKVFDLVIEDPRVMYFILGGCIAFGIGLWDDIRRLNPWLKFFFQVLAALTAYWGGIRIGVIGLPGTEVLSLGWLSLPATVFWILLVINAINLSDGLDGLAAGIGFFVSIILVVLSVLQEQFLVALGLAALGGTTLGFLRYNFFPASIFMGDSGSYFIGYMLAALSILGSVKSQTAVTIMIPMIALGLPLLETIWATIRRFLLGKKLFSPDKEHFHHRLLKLGLNQRRAVLVLYGATICMGVLALVMVHASNERAALLLLLLGVTVIFGIRKLGYFKYIGRENIVSWIKDFTDEAGFNPERRRFLSLQIGIARSTNIEELWQSIISVLEMLEFDKGALYLNVRAESKGLMEQSGWKRTDGFKRRKTPPAEASVIMRKAPPEYDWSRPPFVMEDYVCSRSILRLELPLLDKDKMNFGTLVLVKDMRLESFDEYTLRRVEHLRRTIVSTLGKMGRTEDG